MCTLLKLSHQLGYAECTVIVTLRSNCTHRVSRHLTLCQPFCQTNLHYYSFLPYTLSLWSKLKLDLSIVSSSSFSSILWNCMHRNLFYHCCVYLLLTYLCFLLTYYLHVSHFCNCCKLAFQFLWSNVSVLAYVCYVHISMHAWSKFHYAMTNS